MVFSTKSRIDTSDMDKGNYIYDKHNPWYAGKILQRYFIPEYFLCMSEVKLQDSTKFQKFHMM